MKGLLSTAACCGAGIFAGRAFNLAHGEPQPPVYYLAWAILLLCAAIIILPPSRGDRP